jgi:hypothetical protein
MHLLFEYNNCVQIRYANLVIEFCKIFYIAEIKIKIKIIIYTKEKLDKVSLYPSTKHPWTDMS